MKKLMVLDKQDYEPCMEVCTRYCVRGIIERNGCLAMQKSSAGDYKILGGGMDPGEDVAESLAREVQEESGLVIRKDTIRGIGEIVERHRDIFKPDMIYECHTLFYQCDAEDEMVESDMTASEIAKGFSFCWATPQEIIAGNEKFLDQTWTLRDTSFIEWWIAHHE